MTLICCAMRPSITMARDGELVAQEGHAIEIAFARKMAVRSQPTQLPTNPCCAGDVKRPAQCSSRSQVSELDDSFRVKTTILLAPKNLYPITLTL
jgi:hypothetical protein